MARSCPHCGRETNSKSFLCGRCEMPHLTYVKQETGSPAEELVFEFLDAHDERFVHWNTIYKDDGYMVTTLVTNPKTTRFRRTRYGSPVPSFP